MFEKISYKRFCWSLGTTSFRTKNFNRTIETQIAMLNRFWRQPENADEKWEGNNDVQTRYYEYMQDEGFVDGDAPRPDKEARQKTSGLVEIGLLNDNRRLTGAGCALLEICSKGDFTPDNIFRIEKDSYLYLKQLLKTSCDIDGNIVRPLLILLHFLNDPALDGKVTKEEFTYLLPLCINEDTTEWIGQEILKLRAGKTSIDAIINGFIADKPNYREARNLLMSNAVSEELICAVGINRKSPKYDKAYYGLYNSMLRLYLYRDDSAAKQVLSILNGLTNKKITTAWKSLQFDTSVTSRIEKDPFGHFCASNPFCAVTTEDEFKELFFDTMHLYKTKATLSDYCDLNRRYLSTADIIIFKDDEIKLDVIPEQLFSLCEDKLYEIAFTKSADLCNDVPLSAISGALKVSEELLIEKLGEKFKKKFADLEDAMSEVDKERYARFDKLIDERFADDDLINLLGLFEERNDEEISALVTDNATVPTIFEYVLGIIWYKVSNRKGKVLDYMKLSLDANLLPKTHAAGGEADIVYEYPDTQAFPAHHLLLEATLANVGNQRQMEAEPVTRHLGNNILATGNKVNYCVFVSTSLNPNIISDFRSRKRTTWYDTNDVTRKVQGMKIIPLSTGDIRSILSNKHQYHNLYAKFESAFSDTAHDDPYEWYVNCVTM